MKNIVSAFLILSAVAVGACKDSEPPMAPNIRDKLNVEDPTNLGEKDQTPEQECHGEPTDEMPEFDLAVEAEQQEIRVKLHIQIAEAKGLEVCTVHLIVRHRTLDEETGEWEPDGQMARMMIPKIRPGEISEMHTPVRPAEFPRVTEAGSPEAWSVEVVSWHEVRKPIGWKPPPEAS